MISWNELSRRLCLSCGVHRFTLTLLQLVSLLVGDLLQVMSADNTGGSQEFPELALIFEGALESSWSPIQKILTQSGGPFCLLVYSEMRLSDASVL